MNVTKNLSLQINNFGITLNILIILNYVAWVLNVGALFGPIIIGLFFLIFFTFGLIAALNDTNKFLVFLYCLSLLIFALGSRTTGWDTRTIWLFHAKRIYYDNNFYAQLDNYGSFSHNDYPNIIPVLASSIGFLFDSWNEIFPKISSSMAICATLICISNYISSRWKIVLFIGCLTLIFGYHKVDVGSYLTNGYMDPILALYTLLAVINIKYLVDRDCLFNEKSWYQDAFSLSIIGFILVLIKNEGFFLLCSILLAFYISGRFRINWRIMISVFIPILTSLIWRYLVARSGIVNDLAGSNILEKLSIRLFDYQCWLLILKKIPIYFWVLVFLYVYMNKYSLINFIALLSKDAVAIFVSIYLLVLLFVYITTRHDLAWHLETSIDRTILPLSIVLLYFIFYPRKECKVQTNKKHKSSLHYITPQCI